MPLNCLGAIQNEQRGDLFGPRSKTFLSDLLLETPKTRSQPGLPKGGGDGKLAMGIEVKGVIEVSSL